MGAMVVKPVIRLAIMAITNHSRCRVLSGATPGLSCISSNIYHTGSFSDAGVVHTLTACGVTSTHQFPLASSYMEQTHGFFINVSLCPAARQVFQNTLCPAVKIIFKKF